MDLRVQSRSWVVGTLASVCLSFAAGTPAMASTDDKGYSTMTTDLLLAASFGEISCTAANLSDKPIYVKIEVLELSVAGGVADCDPSEDLGPRCSGWYTIPPFSVRYAEDWLGEGESPSHPVYSCKFTASARDMKALRAMACTTVWERSAIPSCTPAK